MEEFEESTTIASDDVLSTAMFCNRHEILSLDLTQKVTPHCNPVFLAGPEMKENTRIFLRILALHSPSFLENGVPDDNFYRDETLSPIASFESIISEELGANPSEEALS